MATQRPRLLIVGASTRAAAWSAVRAGFRPTCADQFGDEDLRQVAEVIEATRNLPSFAVDVSKIVADAWMYVGGMENQPAVLTDIARLKPWVGRLLGCAPPLLSLIRDPRALSLATSSMELPTLRVVGLGEAIPASLTRRIDAADAIGRASLVRGDWITKRSHSAGGQHVWRIEPQQVDSQDWRSHEGCHFYLQERAAGSPMSAVLIAKPQAVELVGCTEQFIGDRVAGAPGEFSYCGNIAPVEVVPAVKDTLVAVGEWFRERHGLRGLFGIDFCWDGRHARLVEINPRYTASCELFELARGRPLLTEHWQCFCREDDPPPETDAAVSRKATPSAAAPQSLLGKANGRVLGKLILYARSPVVAPYFSRFLHPRSPWTVPFLADIPAPGAKFETGQPLCTVFASGKTTDVVRQKLYRRAERVRRWFGDLAHLPVEASRVE